MRITLFGNLRITFAGKAVAAIHSNRLQSLLAYLLLHEEAPRERLAFLLWPGSSESQARTNLRQLLHHLKRALPPEIDALETDHFAVRWRHASASVDVADFQQGITDAGAARVKGQRAEEIKALVVAAELYEDDLLPGLYDDWLTPIREDYRKRLAEVLR